MRGEKLTIEQMQKIAKIKGGKCLSTIYKDSRLKLLWQCSKGHKWEARVSNVMHCNSWCPKCKKDVYMKKMHRLAEENSGKCVSKSYKNCSSKLLWECSEGHRWRATPTAIRSRKHWCPKCVGVAPLTIEEMQEIAKSRGGSCLSKSYKNSMSKLLWKCSAGHEWKAPSNTIKYGQWCPKCSSGLGERISRQILEQFTEKEWPKVRPIWLKNNQGNQMELDGYCKELNLAFEYQGKQHYQFVGHFHRRGWTLEQQQQIDKLKKELCINHGIDLIDIPYTIDFKELPEFLKLILEKKTGRPIVSTFKMTISSAYDQGKLKKHQLEVAEKGITLLSPLYMGAAYLHLYRCSKGHEWKAKPNSLRTGTGTGCAVCSRVTPLTIEEMQEIAESREGKCVSTVYVNSLTNLIWKCKEGHQWEATPTRIKHHSSWCPKCKHIKLGERSRGNQFGKANKGKKCSEEDRERMRRVWVIRKQNKKNSNNQSEAIP